MFCHFTNSGVIGILTFWVCFDTAIRKLLWYKWTGCISSEDSATDVAYSSSQNTSDDISDTTYSSTESSTGGRIRNTSSSIISISSSSSSSSSDSRDYYTSYTSESCSSCYSTSESENLFRTPPLHSRQVQFTNRINFSSLWNSGSR